ITVLGEDVVVEEGDTVSNQNGITSVQVAAQYTLADNVSVNGVYVREFNDYGGLGIDAEFDPELYNIGARWSLSDEFELSMNYTEAHTDNANDDERDSFAIASMMDFGEGLTGHLGLAGGSADDAADIDTNVYGYVRQALSDRTNVRLELEPMRLEDDSGDKSNATVALVALQHSF
ncbi:porin, partial [Haloferax sp. KTX1]|uniref:porin n=1 Tax=Haloferax sp. KTX1 TaxID=2600597 RepID=UPI001652A301